MKSVTAYHENDSQEVLICTVIFVFQFIFCGKHISYITLIMQFEIMTL
jgi:hypothetical protein